MADPFNFTHMRPDASGARRGSPVPPRERGDEFPYDMETMVGAPLDHDTGDGRGSGLGGLHGPLIPKHIEDGGPWDELEETIGSPSNMTIANRQGAMQGSLVPGTSGGWARSGKDDLDMPPDDVLEDLISVFVGDDRSLSPRRLSLRDIVGSDYGSHRDDVGEEPGGLFPGEEDTL